MSDNLTLQDRLRLVRRRLRMSQKEFAATLGVTTSAIGNWESGCGNIPESRIVEICSFHGVNREWLETGKGEMLGDPVPDGIDSSVTPYSIAKRQGCNEVVARVFDAVCGMNASDQEVLARLIRKIFESVEGTQQKKQNQKIVDFASKIISAVNYAEGNIVQRGNQSNSASLSNDENSSNGE